MTERTCTNCKSQDTPMWRRHPVTGDSLCNPCGMYIRKHRKDRPLGLATNGYFGTSSISHVGFLSTLHEGPAVNLDFGDYEWLTAPEKPPISKPHLFCIICEKGLGDEDDFYDHLVEHARTPCSVYIERLDQRSINQSMLNQSDSGTNDDDISSVKTEPVRDDEPVDNTPAKKTDGSPGASPARSIDSTETIPNSPAASGNASSTPVGIRVKTLKDLMPTTTSSEHGEGSSAVQRLTQQVERLPQAVTISPSVQITKRPPPPPDSRSAPPVRKMPRLPESISLTPTRTQPVPIAPKMNPPLVNRVPQGRGVNMAPMGGGASMTQRGSIASMRQSFPVSGSVSILPRKPGQPGPPPPSQQMSQQRGHPELRRSLQSRSSSLTCQICDRSFSSPDILQRHMATSHRGSAPTNSQMRPNVGTVSSAANGTFPCNFCRVIYSSEAALSTHKHRIHAAEMNAAQTAANRGGAAAFRSGPAPPELALPIVDVSQRLTRQRLAEKGVKYAVRLTNLTNTARTSKFAIPVVPVEQANNSAYSRVASIAAANIIPLGPLTSVKQ